MQYLAAVSGGVDSVVMLDMLAKEKTHQLTVAHFDHGIREDSAADARFVAELAKKYNLPFVLKREELGKDASEAFARERRYTFLKEEASKLKAQIATAHHADDVVETVAINLIRGTGWRGLSVLQAQGITRPLLRKTKSDIRAYALENQLEWVEDSTNATDAYLRNRVRRQIARSMTPDQKYKVCELRDKQLILKYAIKREFDALLPKAEESRYFFSMISSETASELLRESILRSTGKTLTRPQLDRALLAIKVARVGSEYEAGEGIRLVLKATTFVVKTP